MERFSSLLMFTVALLLGDSSSAQRKNKLDGYTIQAKIDGVPDGTLFYLTKANASGNGSDTVQTAKSLKGAFTFRGVLPLQGEAHWILIDTSRVKLEKGKHVWLSLILDHSVIKLTGTLQQWPDVNREGSFPTTQWMSYIETSKAPIAEASSIKSNAKGDSLLLKRANKIYRDFTLGFYTSNLDAYVTPKLIKSNSILNVLEKEELYNRLSKRVQNSFYGVQLKEYFAAEKIRAQIGIDKRLPDFKISTPEGKTISVLEVASKAEYTLIDFWASWCKPCRAAIPKMKAVYEKYHDKGFNILGISTDAQVAAWKKALVQDGTKWSHGIDNIEYAERKIFDIGAIPAYLLIDRNGILLDAVFMSNSLSIPSSGRFGKKSIENDLEGILEQLFEEK